MSPLPLPSRQPSSSLPPPPHSPAPLLSAQSSQQPLPSPLPLPSPSLQLSPLYHRRRCHHRLRCCCCHYHHCCHRHRKEQHNTPSNRENDNGGRGRVSHVTVTHLSPKAKKMLSYGLSLVGFGNKRQKCWEALSIVQQLVSDLKKYDEPFNLPNLFMALYWLKQYNTEEVMAGKWRHGEQNCRENTKKYVKLIRSMKSKKSHFVDCIQSANLLLMIVCTSYAMSLGVTQTANGGHINQMVLGYPLTLRL